MFRKTSLALFFPLGSTAFFASPDPRISRRWLMSSATTFARPRLER